MIVSSVISRPVQVSVLSNTYAVNIAALKAIDISEMAGNTQISVAGYYTPGDGGGGTFYYDSGSSTTDNGGTVIAPDVGSGRWKRIYSGAVNVKWFGAKGDGTTVDTAAFTAALASSPHIIVPTGTYRVKNIAAVAGMNISGPRDAVLKLTDDSVTNDCILSGGDDADGVSIYGISFDGNRTTIGLSNVRLGCIHLIGGCSNWSIDGVKFSNPCGDGIYTSWPSVGGTYPVDINVYNCVFSNSGRQDIAIVVCSGATISNCIGSGNLDVENGNNTAHCDNISISNCRFNHVSIIPYTSDTGVECNISVSNVTTAAGFLSWRARGLIINGLNVTGAVELSELYDSLVSNVVCDKLYVDAPNSGYSDGNTISNIQVRNSADSARGIELYNVKNTTFSKCKVAMTGLTSIGVYVGAHSSATLSGSTVVFDDMDVSATQYGIRIVNNSSAFTGSEHVIRKARITSAASSAGIGIIGTGTNAWGKFKIIDCEVSNIISVNEFESAVLLRNRVIGDFNVVIKFGTTCYITVDDLVYERATYGTSTLLVQSNTLVKHCSISGVRAVSPGSIGASMANFSSTTFDTGVKVTFFNVQAASTSWLANLADASITEGSMYRLLGNTTNWGYTHNGTAWVAKAH